MVGRLKGDLPELFSLHAVLPPKLEESGAATVEPPEFVATLSPEGILQMRGRLRDETQELLDNNVRLVQLGRRDGLPPDVLDAMDETDREVLALRHFEQLTNKEVAETLELSPTAASNRYVRALQRLGEILGSLPGFQDVAP